MPRPTSYRRLALLNLLLASQGKRILSTIEKSTKDSRRKSEAFLLSWIRKNEKTEFGREHHFSDIRSVSDYQRLVPLSEYSDYLPSLSRMEKGEKDLLFRGKPSYYNETSGTTGKSKRIPVSPLQEKAIARKGNPQLIPALEKKNGCFDLRHRRILALMANTDLSYTEDGTPVGDVVSMMLKDVSGLMNLFFTTPLVSLASPEVHDRMYVHLLFGLQDKDVYLLMSAYQSEIVGMVDYLFRNEALLLHDIREGRISSEVKISSSLKEELEWRLRPNPERAEELRTILSDPDREGILVRIWPYLKTVSGVGSETGNLAPYTSLLRHYLGKEGHLYFGAYSASEGLMAISPDYDEASYLPLIDTSFLEFLPLGQGASSPLLPEDLEVGRRYETVLTNLSGFYRYRMHDVVEVVSKDGDLPRIKVLGRSLVFLDVMGEKLTFEQADEAISRLSKRLGSEHQVLGYSGTLLLRPEGYTFFLEVSRPEDLSSEEVAQELKEELVEVAPDVGYAFRHEGLLPPQVFFVQPDTFLDFSRRENRPEIPSRHGIKAVKQIRDSGSLGFFLRHRIPS